MATTPEGTPYVESSDLVANYPAASLALANRVDLVGVLPFATSTARGTAIPSPTDGQYTYLQDTNTTQFWNGAAWQTAGLTPGTQIVTPTSIANSGGSASASGGQVTFTGVSSVSLNGCFTSAFENYVVHIYSAASTNIDIGFRLRAAGTDAAGGNYFRQTAAFFVTSSSFSQDGPLTSWTDFLNSSTVGGSAFVNLYRPALAAETYIQSFGGRTGLMSMRIGDHNLTTAYDGITFIAPSGNMTGRVRVYGYQSS